MHHTVGILNIYKPIGISSRNVVDRLQSITSGVKVGHAGTLDPLACGVLLVATGSATRLIPYLQAQPKHYRATFVLGMRSETDDLEGPLFSMDYEPLPDRETVERTLREFVGLIKQRPPCYSAVHINGVRAYQRARRGESVEPEPKWVEIFEIKLLKFCVIAECQAPVRQDMVGKIELQLDIHCARGTYIRSVSRDLGDRLGCGAVMTALERRAIGDFEISGSTVLAALGEEDWKTRLLPPVSAVPHLSHVAVNSEQKSRVICGLPVLKWARVNRNEGWNGFENGEELGVLYKKELLAIAKFHEETQQLLPRRVFPVS